MNYHDGRVMREKLLILAVVVVGLLALSGVASGQTADPDGVDVGEVECEFPFEPGDGLRASVTSSGVEEKPDTLVTASPSVSQIVWEMGIEDRVVGVGSRSFSQYLDGINDERIDDITVFAADSSFDEEAFIQDVSQADNGEPADVAIGALFVTGLDQVENWPDSFERHWFFTSESFEDIQKKVLDIGSMTGECEAAEEVVEDMQDTIDRVERSVEFRDEPVVMFGAPSEGQDNFVPVEGTFKHDIITTAGGENVYATIGMEDEDGLEQLIGDEKVAEALSEDPDWIVLAGQGPEAIPDEGVDGDLYSQTTAVQEDQILTVDQNFISQDGPRVVIPLERMARAFHPGAFTDETTSIGGGGSGESDGLPEPDIDVEEVTQRLSPVDDDVSRAEFSDGPVDAVEINAEVEGDVTSSVVDTGDAPGAPVQRVSITVPEEARESSGTVRFLVDSDRLEAADVPADDLLAVKDDGGWMPLDTTTLETDDGVTVVADTPSFSDFAVVASTPPVALVDASAEDGTVTLSAADSYDEYGEVVGYEWTVEDEEYDGETVEVEADEGQATLTVTNDAGLTNETTVEFSVDEETSEDETEAEEDEEDDDIADDEPAEEEGLPGFTAVAALVALISFALVRR